MALSRTSHGILDVATPVLAALVWLGNFPPPFTMIVGFITALAGYTAVYAFNDLVDYEVDKERLGKGGRRIHRTTLIRFMCVTLWPGAC